MKKILCIIFSICILVAHPTITPAAQNTTLEMVEYMTDGSYFVTTISYANSSDLRASTRTGSKTTTYKSSSGESLWSVTVTGSFSYTGTSSTCTSSSVSATAYSSSWKITNSSSSKSGNSAVATATATQYRSFIPIDSISKTVTLTCSSSGSLS